MNTLSFMQLLDISISSLAVWTLRPTCMLLFTAAINNNLFDFKQSFSLTKCWEFLGLSNRSTLWSAPKKQEPGKFQNCLWLIFKTSVNVLARWLRGKWAGGRLTAEHDNLSLCKEHTRQKKITDSPRGPLTSVHTRKLAHTHTHTRNNIFKTSEPSHFTDFK